MYIPSNIIIYVSKTNIVRKRLRKIMLWKGVNFGFWKLTWSYNSVFTCICNPISVFGYLQTPLINQG